jgi:hypothetical protein
VCEVAHRVALHLEVTPIRYVRGLKSSLVIGQRFKSVLTPLHLEAGPIWWYDLLLLLENAGYDTA